MKYYSAGGVVLAPSGKIVVVNQNGDSWSLPKGRIEVGEEPLDAALREIYEETGLRELKLLTLLGSYERPTIGRGGIGEDKNQMKHLTFFLFTSMEAPLQPIDPDNPEARWVSFSEAVKLLHHAKDKEFLKNAQQIIEAEGYLK